MRPRGGFARLADSFTADEEASDGVLHVVDLAPMPPAEPFPRPPDSDQAQGMRMARHVPSLAAGHAPEANHTRCREGMATAA
jgi:hypothetical protein